MSAGVIFSKRRNGIHSKDKVLPDVTTGKNLEDIMLNKADKKTKMYGLKYTS